MPFEIRLTADQIKNNEHKNNEHKNYNPSQYDFLWNEDYTECDVYKLNWCGDDDYAEYQGDPTEGTSEANYYKDQAGRCPGEFADKDPGDKSPFQQQLYAGITTHYNDSDLPF